MKIGKRSLIGIVIEVTTIREACPTDIPAIVGLVKELAEFEKSPESVLGTVESFTSCMFPQSPAQPSVWAHVAEIDGQIVGMAVWFLTFSTWTGTNGLWLEDLYVKPQFRGQRIASALMKQLATICIERGYPRFEWICLNWNESALRIYDHLGAQQQSEWQTLRLSGPNLAALANK